jgi:hypothetical protein
MCSSATCGAARPSSRRRAIRSGAGGGVRVAATAATLLLLLLLCQVHASSVVVEQDGTVGAAVGEKGDDDDANTQQGTCSSATDPTCSASGGGSSLGTLEEEEVEEEAADGIAADGSTIPPLPGANADGYVAVPYGEAQKIGTAGESSYDAAWQRLQTAQRYMYGTVYNHSNADDSANAILRSVAGDCSLQHELCTYWCSIGACSGE